MKCIGVEFKEKGKQYLMSTAGTDHGWAANGCCYYFPDETNYVELFKFGSLFVSITGLNESTVKISGTHTTYTQAVYIYQLN